MADTDRAKPGKKKKRRTRAQRKADSKIRRAQKAQVEAAWQEQVDTHFSYLREQFGFSIGTLATTSALFIGYVSAVGAVRVDRSLDASKPKADVYLTRHAVNGVFPLGRNFVWLDDLLRARAPEQYRALQKIRGMEPEQIEQSLAFQAQAMREYAADILRGDFSAFAEIDELLKGPPPA